MKDKFDELAIIWFQKARGDLSWIRHDFKGKFYGMVCFGSQQIAEKTLKAYLFSQREKLVKTHNLIRLLRKCNKYDSSFQELLHACKVLNGYYVDTRYPDIWDYSRFDDKSLAEEALRLAKEVLEFVSNKIEMKGMIK